MLYFSNNSGLLSRHGGFGKPFSGWETLPRPVPELPYTSTPRQLCFFLRQYRDRDKSRLKSAADPRGRTQIKISCPRLSASFCGKKDLFPLHPRLTEKGTLLCKT